VTREGLAGKSIVVTGASSGFGRGAALEFAKDGAHVVLAARRAELLERLVTECEGLGGRAIAVPTDVSRRDDVERLAERAVAAFGRIDVWINDAGVGALGRFEDVPLEDHVQVVATDLLGTIAGSYVAYKCFLEQGAGILVNVASELGRYTVPYYASYAAAKHGVVGLSQALRQEIELEGHEGIHVCLVMPSAHDTPFFDHVANYTGREVRPPKPLHDPEDVVETLVRLARDPKDEEIVGGDGVVKVLLKRLAPGVQEHLAARLLHKTQMEDPPPARDSPGAVRAPMEAGTGVSAGRRESG
jgi:NAD(P)-dependent dehydrogenase (short-subunit alcohol dehydrogenase family)